MTGKPGIVNNASGMTRPSSSPDSAADNKKNPLIQVGDSIESLNAGWSFGGTTPAHFETHVRRSIPFYEEGHRLICNISDFFVKPDSVCYELGSAVGELTTALAAHHPHKPGVRWIGVDNEAPMVQKARDRNTWPNVEFITEDITLMTYEKSDLIVAYYTVQFVPPRRRQDLFNAVYNALNWGGAFLLFEKVRGADARFQDILTTLYTEFKLNNGYTAEEIVAKSRSLKGILEPFSTQGNLDLMHRAGFQDIITVMKYLCFEGFLAIK